MPTDQQDAFATFFDLAVSALQHAIYILRSSQQLLTVLRNDPSVAALAQYAMHAHGKVPESASFALTAAAVFVSSFLVLRFGRSMLSLAFLLIQILLVSVAGFVAWRFRENLWDFANWLVN